MERFTQCIMTLTFNIISPSRHVGIASVQRGVVFRIAKDLFTINNLPETMSSPKKNTRKE